MHGQDRLQSDGLVSPPLIDLYIETLTGAAFQMKVSPYETILSLKSMIHQLEGIPVGQQHLLWHSQELNDDERLHDRSIPDGSTLRLVLGMRGGPITMKRVSTEESVLREMKDYVEANKDELMDSVGSNSQVTLLVFRDGENLNVVKVVERVDGTYSSLSSRSVSSSAGNSRGIAKVSMTDEEDDVSNRKTTENLVTKQKMKMLRSQMQAIYNTGHQNVPRRIRRVPRQKGNKTQRKKSNQTSTQSTNKAKRQSQNGDKKKVHLPLIGRNVDRRRRRDMTEDDDVDTDESNSDGKMTSSSEWILRMRSSTDTYDNRRSRPGTMFSNPSRVTTGSKMKELRQALNSNGTNQNRNDAAASASRVKQNNRLASTARRAMTSSWGADNTEDRGVSTTGISLLDSLSRLSLVNDNNLLHRSLNNVQPLPDINRNKANRGEDSVGVSKDEKTSAVKLANPDPIHRNDHDGRKVREGDDVHLSGAATRALRILDILSSNAGRHQTTDAVKVGVSSSAMGAGQKHSESTSLLTSNNGRNVETTRSGDERTDGIGNEAKLRNRKDAASLRCGVCNKKTGLVNSFLCRCGVNYCSIHRYAEMHSCRFDYKTEGRKILQKSNPLVTASKVHKI